MESLDDNHPAGPQRLDDLRRQVSNSHVAEHDQIPLGCAPCEIVVSCNRRRDLYAELLCLLLGRRYRSIGRIEPDRIPSLLREINSVSALTHSDVERSTGLEPLGHGDEK